MSPATSTRRVFLHIGAPKSGTTYLQAVLGANKERLLDAGLLFPGSKWGDQVRAVQDVRRMPVPARHRPERKGAWRRLVKEVGAHEGDSIVSMEWLCAAEPKHITRIVEDLSFAEVHVVLTVRPLADTLASSWQQQVKGMHRWGWREHLTKLSSAESELDPEDAAVVQRFWARHDVLSILERWGAEVPTERTHVITVPPRGSDPDELWHRMCTVLGIDGTGYVTEGLLNNESLGMETIEVLQRLIPVAEAIGISPDGYSKAVRRGMARKGIPGAPRGSRVTLPTEHYPWVRERSEGVVAGVRERGVEVVGDLEDLVSGPPPADATQPEDLTAEDLLVPAIHALAATMREYDALLRPTLERPRRRPKA